jgi:Nuclease-related domain
VDRQTKPVSARLHEAPLVEQRPAPLPPRPGLAADPRLPIWIRRIVIALVLFTAATIWQNWRLGLTVAIIAGIIDAIFRSKTMGMIPAAVRVSSAQRMTRRRLVLTRPSGYLALHARAIPGTESVIDHLVVGPGGVFAVDSERWDRRLPVHNRGSRSAAGPILYHGPFSQKERLAHARWEAAQAARLLSEELGTEIRVRPVMIIYGPRIPWNIATLRGVDVFTGRKAGSYFRRRNQASDSDQLSWDQVGDIYEAAGRALPPI